jgi:hypothetical protein
MRDLLIGRTVLLGALITVVALLALITFARERR